MRETERNSLELLARKIEGQPGSLRLPWPDGKEVGGLRNFDTFDEWFRTFSELGLTSCVPQVLMEKYGRAQKTFLAAWLDPDLIKAGELVALTALEFAVTERYGHRVTRLPSRKKPTFAGLLDFMVTGDGLTDDLLPFTQKYGGTAVAKLCLNRHIRPTIAEIRNQLAHGHPFDNMPAGGLLELVRDLIDYAYRDWPEQ